MVLQLLWNIMKLSRQERAERMRAYKSSDVTVTSYKTGQPIETKIVSRIKPKKVKTEPKTDPDQLQNGRVRYLMKKTPHRFALEAECDPSILNRFCKNKKLYKEYMDRVVATWPLIRDKI